MVPENFTATEGDGVFKVILHPFLAAEPLGSPPGMAGALLVTGVFLLRHAGPREDFEELGFLVPEFFLDEFFHGSGFLLVFFNDVRLAGHAGDFGYRLGVAIHEAVECRTESIATN